MRPVNVRGKHLRLYERHSVLKSEPEVLDFIDKIPVGSVLYDLGACVGSFSLYASAKNIKCFSFEPEPVNYNLFVKNILANQSLKNNINHFKLGVGETNHIANMKVGQPAGGHHRIIVNPNISENVKTIVSKSKGNAKVNVISLDDFIKKNNLPNPNYMKIDIDGSEVPFINGAKETLQCKELKAIIFELDSVDDKKIIDTVLKYGFKESSRNHIMKNLYNIVFEK